MLEEYTEKEHDKINSIVDKIKDQQSIIDKANIQIEQIKAQFKKDLPKGTWIKIKKKGTISYVQIQDLDITKRLKAKIYYNKIIIVNKFGISMSNNIFEGTDIDLDKIISIGEEELMKELNNIHFKKFFSC